MKNLDMPKVSGNKTSGFSLNTAQTLKLLRAVPRKTKCYQFDEENSFSYEYIGTTDEVRSRLDVPQQGKTGLHWNCGDETVFPVELAFVVMSDIENVCDDDNVDTGEFCLLMRYRQCEAKLDFPKLSEARPQMPITFIRL